MLPWIDISPGSPTTTPSGSAQSRARQGPRRHRRRLVSDELVLAFPREAGGEVGRGRGGVRDGEVQEEGGKPAAGRVAGSECSPASG